MRNAPKVHAARSRTLLDLLLAAELQRGRARLSGIPVPVVRYLLEEIPGPVRAREGGVAHPTSSRLAGFAGLRDDLESSGEGLKINKSLVSKFEIIIIYLQLTLSLKGVQGM